MSTYTLSAATPDDAESIRDALRAFNRRAIGEIAFEPVAFVARDPSGALVGGIVGDVYLHWLAIDVLWVDDAQRGSGLGSVLLERAERAAVELGAHSAMLDTFGWQAEGFYAKHGYMAFGRLDDFPPGHARVYMRKALTGSDRPATLA
jgi:GNAT superfamily N-acetyltransferase